MGINTVRRRSMDEFWMNTYSGKAFHFLNPQPDEIDIVDIAHHLSLLCRYTGAVKKFYSVAEHCVRVAQELPPALRLAGLLHDAAEAYINDISSPVKASHKLEETEARITAVINQKYELANPFPEEVKKMDKVMMATEVRDLMPSGCKWQELPVPLIRVIIPWTSDLAEWRFKEIFKWVRQVTR